MMAKKTFKDMDSKKAQGDAGLFKCGKNMVLYPVFLECVNYTVDDFWKNMFEQLSYGKCPSCIYISNNTVYCSNKKKGFSFIIPLDDTRNAAEVFTELKALLMKNTALCSTIDTREKRAKMKEDNDESEITSATTWTEIRKKNVKELYIIKFTIRMKHKYRVEWSVVRQLYSLIQVGILSKTQSSRDFDFKMGRIQSIRGITYDDTLGRFVNEYCDNIVAQLGDETEDSTQYLYYYWDKYISTVSRLA